MYIHITCHSYENGSQIKLSEKPIMDHPHEKSKPLISTYLLAYRQKFKSLGYRLPIH